MNKDFLNALKKRAEGFFYEEVYTEYERLLPKKWVFCKKFKHLIHCDSGSYLKISVDKNGKAVELETVKFLCKSNCFLKKIFTIKTI